MSDNKIVIVAGQEFSVPASTPNESIRTQLSTMGFTDVANATIQTGTRTVDGQEIETIEFVKKAGTKGLSGQHVAQLLTAAPMLIEESPRQRLRREQRKALASLLSGRLTVDQALNRDLRTSLTPAMDANFLINQQGAMLCQRLHHLPAVPVAEGAAVCGW